jgi:SEC-C motif-containing protein
MTTSDCPCGSAKPLAQCCQPYIDGRAQPPTAQALMRARYTSFVIGRIDFVEATHDPEAGDNFDRKAAEKWSKESQWKGLHIVAVKDGGPEDETGIVTFVALFAQGGKDYRHEEMSRFRKKDGRWLFVEALEPQKTFEKKGPDLGRNDPCHCGSGKKFKKCHGAAAA